MFVVRILTRNKRKNKNACKMAEELAKYLEKKYTLGSPEELEYKIENSKNPTEKYINEQKIQFFILSIYYMILNVILRIICINQTM